MLCDQQLGWFCRDDVWKEDINGKHDKDKQVTVSASSNRFESALPSTTLKGGYCFFLGTFATYLFTWWRGIAPANRDFCLFLTLFPHHILKHLSLIQHGEVNIHSTFSRSLDIRVQRGYASSGCITNKSMDTESAREGSRDQHLFRLWHMYIIFLKKDWNT